MKSIFYMISGAPGSGNNKANKLKKELTKE